MIETGKILQQRYRIDKQIGQGGMGAVYVATDERFGSTVAIKETLCMDDNYRKALEREARLLNSLKHAALPRVSDHFLESNSQFLVMEYIPGEDLCSIQESDDKPFPIGQVLDWADQLLEALDFLHNQVNPVIHRDIKPQNLKITPRGQIVLLDFGLAKGNVTGAGNQTAAKSIFGYSRNYASLEQIQGTGTDPRSDLYSLAATLYHLATNTPPEDALTRAMAVLNHQPDPLIPANAVAPSIPPGVAAILQIAMSLNASSRPASAAEMREMLRDHESYAGLEAAAAAPAAVGGEFLAQSTKLMPGTTRQAGERQTHIKTQILPEYISQETSIRGVHGTAGIPSEPKSRFFAAAALAAIATLCLAAGGIYYSQHSKWDAAAPEQLVPSDPQPAVEADKNPAPESPAPAVSTMAESSAPDAASQQTRTQAATSKGTKTVAASKKKAAAGPGEAIVNGDEVDVGNVKIRNGVVETPDTYIDENGIRRKIPGMRIPQPPIDPQTLKYLTPEQREKLKMLNRRNMRFVVPRPTPRQ